MDQRIFILILVIFLLSTNLTNVFNDITKSFFYLIIILYMIKIINPSMQSKFKDFLIGIINFDTNGISNLFSSIATKIKKLIFTSYN
jgi:hypothetical protein